MFTSPPTRTGATRPTTFGSKTETHKVSLDRRRESNKILAIFKKKTARASGGEGEIDESYFDLTVEVRKLMVERFPYLANPPPDDR